MLKVAATGAVDSDSCMYSCYLQQLEETMIDAWEEVVVVWNELDDLQLNLQVQLVVFLDD